MLTNPEVIVWHHACSSDGNLVLLALCGETQNLYRPCLCTHGRPHDDLPPVMYAGVLFFHARPHIATDLKLSHNI
jgi:hypothetical protein